MPPPSPTTFGGPPHNGHGRTDDHGSMSPASATGNGVAADRVAGNQAPASQAAANQTAGGRAAGQESAGQQPPEREVAARQQTATTSAPPTATVHPPTATVYPTGAFPTTTYPSSARPSWATTHSSAHASLPGATGGAVPQQRTAGTVYGGAGAYPEMTMRVPASSLESSGSLTGHILAQGWVDTPHTRRRGNTKTVVVMLLVLAGMIGLSVLFLFTAGDAISRFFMGLF